jgi:ABC-2 type transport system permease protein
MTSGEATSAANHASRILMSVPGFCRKTLAVADLELRKLRRDPTELVTRAIQPALWLLLFGEVMSRSRALSGGGVPYLEFLLPGILAQSVLFIAIFNGISIIWERDLGIVHKFLASPTPRTALVVGKSLGGAFRALVQAVVVLLLGLALGVHLRLDPIALGGVALLVVLGAMVFSTFSLIIACLVKTRERFMGIGQVLTMPLFFASNAIYPIAIMPGWLQLVARLNPLTYEVDGLRTLLLAAPNGMKAAYVGLPIDIGVLAAIFVALVVVAARQYPKIVQ